MARLLLDTHTLLWYAQNDPRLPLAVAQAVQAAGAGCFISRATLWEVAIKNSLGKLLLPIPFAAWQAAVRTQGFTLLEIGDTHLQKLNELPYPGDHRDPFDRLLIAQALAEDLTLVSRDAKFADYAVPVRWG